jgi:AraC family transcriptional regulator
VSEWTETEARGQFTGTLANVVEVTGRNMHVRCSDSRTGDRAEFSYAAPLHKVCIMLRGGTRATEAWADGERCYRGHDFPGAVTIIPAGSTRRSILWDGSYRVIAIALSPDSLKRAADQSDGAAGDPRLAPQSNVENARLFAFGSAMYEMLRQPEPTPLLLDSVAAHLGNLLVARSADNARGQSVYGLPPRALCRCVEFIEAHLDQDIPLDTVATQAGLGAFAFLRAFKASTGQTPHQFVLRARIERAKVLLATSNASVAMIAMDVGFSSHSHFSAAFRRLVGVAPQVFRHDTRAGRPEMVAEPSGI